MKKSHTCTINWIATYLGPFRGKRAKGYPKQFRCREINVRGEMRWKFRPHPDYSHHVSRLNSWPLRFSSVVGRLMAYDVSCVNYRVRPKSIINLSNAIWVMSSHFFKYRKVKTWNPVGTQHLIYDLFSNSGCFTWHVFLLGFRYFLVENFLFEHWLWLLF